MRHNRMVANANQYIGHLCNVISTRRLGTQGNCDATAYFQAQVAQFGFSVRTQPFDCIESRLGASTLNIDNVPFEIHASPFARGCDCSAELVCAETLAELESSSVRGKILLLHGEVAREQLMPKGFVFYNPDEHQHIYHVLEEKQPAAILTATSKNPDAVGAIYPFPMIEDGDFDIPTAYLKDVEGERLLAYQGKKAALNISAERIPSHGENVLASTGGSEKIVVCAHIDTKENTPGALDNASGISIMLLLAELLKEYAGDLGVEIVALNGEEYYNTPGQLEYLRQYADDFSSIQLAINLDDIGYVKGRTAFSFYGVQDEIAGQIRSVYKGKSDFFEGPPWFQSDHGIFMAKGVPAMAITEENVLELMAEVTHTEQDNPAIIDPGKLADNALALHEIISHLNNRMFGQKSRR